MTKYFHLDEEYRLVLEKDPSRRLQVPPASTAEELRAHLDAEFDARPDRDKIPNDVAVSKQNAAPKSRKSEESLDLYVFTPKSVASNPDDQQHRSPAVVYVHGGGFVAGNVGRHFQGALSALAKEMGRVVFAPEYRLAPEHPCPAAIEDVLNCLVWVVENADKCGVDREKITLVGGSAGAAIATAAALAWAGTGASELDLPPNRPKFAKLVLLSPMLDDRTLIHPDDVMNGVHTWTSEANTIAWRAYLAGESGPKSTEDAADLRSLPTRPWHDDYDASAPHMGYYYAPGRLSHGLHVLPKTYIDVGGADLFKDECLRFVNRLVDANVEVEFHLWPGVPHGFHGRAPHIRLSKVSRQSQLRAMSGK